MILPLLCWAGKISAQVPEHMPPEQWQLTIDVIKSKARTLMAENNVLQSENQQLTRMMQDLQRKVEEQKIKNDRISRFLNGRHNRSDQQQRIDELMQSLKLKRQQSGLLDGQLQELNRRQAGLEHKIRLLNEKLSYAQIRQPSEEKRKNIQNISTSQGDDQLGSLHRQLEESNKQEVLLQNELEGLNAQKRSQRPGEDAIGSENRQLEARLEALRLQKSQHEGKLSDERLNKANGQRYEELKKRKDELEAAISAYEARMDELRDSSLMNMSWPLKKKRLIHRMVQTDARNNQMRDKIKVLHEDIAVLKDQVAKLERRVIAVQGKDKKPEQKMFLPN